MTGQHDIEDGGTIYEFKRTEFFDFEGFYGRGD